MYRNYIVFYALIKELSRRIKEFAKFDLSQMVPLI